MTGGGVQLSRELRPIQQQAQHSEECVITRRMDQGLGFGCWVQGTILSLSLATGIVVDGCDKILGSPHSRHGAQRGGWRPERERRGYANPEGDMTRERV